MIFVGIAAVLCTIEWLIKRYIDKNKKLGEAEILVKDKADLIYMKNKGALLNTFEDKPKLVSSVMLVALGALIAIFVDALKTSNSKLRKIGLTIMTAGAVNNVIERVKKGYVVDYINLKNNKVLKKIVFNLADAMLAVGAIITLAGEIINKDK